jgi:hypothetical protein
MKTSTNRTLIGYRARTKQKVMDAFLYISEIEKERMIRHITYKTKKGWEKGLPETTKTAKEIQTLITNEAFGLGISSQSWIVVSVYKNQSERNFRKI